MLTKKQKKWIEHLSNDSKINIIPFDPSSKERFEKIKKKIKLELGKMTRVEHCGATSLGISGQDEIDTYVPVSPQNFNKLIPKLANLFGSPRSLYPLERVRFVTHEGNKRIDVFLINKESQSWLDSRKFENYLRAHPKSLMKYQQLKELGNGLGTRDYYKIKLEFINDILFNV